MKKLCIVAISIVMIGCTNKEIKVDGSKTVSQFEDEQKKYERNKNKRTNALDNRIKKFDKDSAKNLESMGTTPTIPKY